MMRVPVEKSKDKSYSLKTIKAHGGEEKKGDPKGFIYWEPHMHIVTTYCANLMYHQSLYSPWEPQIFQ